MTAILPKIKCSKSDREITIKEKYKDKKEISQFWKIKFPSKRDLCKPIKKKESQINATPLKSMF